MGSNIWRRTGRRRGFFVLISFATAIGLAVSSVSPTWRDTSVGLVVLSGAWVVLTAVGSFALGGRTHPFDVANPDEVHFRDGLHGLVVWSVAVIIGAGLTWGTAATINASTSKSSLLNPASSTVNTSGSEPSFLTFGLDRLFWSDNRQQATDAQTRAQAGRILERGLGKRELAKDDHDHLVQLVSARSGLPPADADRRVAQVLSGRKGSSKCRYSSIHFGCRIGSWSSGGVGCSSDRRPASR
jgi:hypothetical protein